MDAFIDFGTTLKSLGTMRADFEKDPLKISANKPRYQDRDLYLSSMKTPTTFWLTKEGKFVSLSYSAEMKYYNKIALEYRILKKTGFIMKLFYKMKSIERCITWMICLHFVVYILAIFQTVPCLYHRTKEIMLEKWRSFHLFSYF